MKKKRAERYKIYKEKYEVAKRRYDELILAPVESREYALELNRVRTAMRRNYQKMQSNIPSAYMTD